MEIFTTEGIVLQSIVYRDYDGIASLFTPHEGIVKLFVKGAFSNKKGKGAGLTPLNIVEASYTKGRGELFRCSHLDTVGHQLGLRKDFATLEAALQLLQVILSTQQSGKGAPELYLLLLAYLQKLPTALYPAAVTSSFRLKTSWYEGSFHSSSCCSICQRRLQSRYIQYGESFCGVHAPADALPFSEEESLIIDLLLLSRDFNQIASQPVEASLVDKISAAVAFQY